MECMLWNHSFPDTAENSLHLEMILQIMYTLQDYIYSAFTNFAEWFSTNSSKTTELTVTKLYMRQ